MRGLESLKAEPTRPANNRKVLEILTDSLRRGYAGGNDFQKWRF